MVFDSRLTWNDYLYVCYLLRLCASAAMKEVSRFEKRGLSEDYIDEQVESLTKIYDESSYAIGDIHYTDFVHGQIKIAMTNLNLDYINKDIARILLPVAFYSMIIQNESNPSTVTRRLNKVKVDRASPWGNMNPFKPWKEPYRPTPDSERLNGKIRKVTQAALDVNFYSSTLISSETKEIAYQVDSLKDKSQYILFASSIAQAGIFLQKVLSVSSNDTSQLDKVLRLYSVDSLHYTIKACRMLVDDPYVIINGKFPAMVDGGNVEYKLHHDMDICVEYAREKLGCDLLNNTDFTSEKKFHFPISFRKEDSASALKTLAQKGIRKKRLFSSLYEFLCENFIFDFDSLLKYCLDTTVLEEYMDFRSSLDCYLRIEKKLSQCLEELSDSTIDLQSLLSLLRSFNKRQNLLANQPYISEFRNEEEAINDSWHQMFTTLKNMKPLYQRTFPDDKEPFGLDKYSEDDFCDIFDDKDFMWEEEQ